MDIEIRGLHFRHAHGRIHALRGVTLTVGAGESVGLIGPNGAGKSTLLGCLLGFLRPVAGSVRVGGRPADDLAVRARVGALSERPAFPVAMAAADVLAFHHALLRLPARTRRRDVESLLRRVGLESDPEPGPDAAARRRPSGFSHGMRQRLGLAVALLGDPSLLVLDEPATGLDPPAMALLRDEIRGATARGATVILSSHQLDEVERACGRIVVLDRGLVRADQPLASLRAGRRVLRVRALTSEGRHAPATRLLGAGARAGVTVRDATDGAAAYLVEGDDGAGWLIAALMADGLTVTEAVPESPRLEAFFTAAAPC